MNEQVTNKSLRGRASTCVRPCEKPAIILNVLIACEESQAECSAFRDLGHNAYSCDVQMCRKSGNPDWHICGDVTPYLEGRTEFVTQSGQYCSVPRWDLIIAHPPCTYLTKLSAVKLHEHPDFHFFCSGRDNFINWGRFNRLLQGRNFFFRCLYADAPYVAVENPIPLQIAQLPRSSFYACPSWFGVKYTKKTLYWVKNLPPLMPTIEHPNPKSYKNSSRGKYRSRTFPQLAQAIALQWSRAIIEDMTKGL